MAAKLLHGKVCLVTGDYQAGLLSEALRSQTEAVIKLQGETEALARYACLMHVRAMHGGKQ